MTARRLVANVGAQGTSIVRIRTYLKEEARCNWYSRSVWLLAWFGLLAGLMGVIGLV